MAQRYYICNAKDTLLKLGKGEWVTRKWHLFVVHRTSDLIQKQVFPANDSRLRVYDCLCCGLNQSQHGYLTVLIQLVRICLLPFQWFICRGSSILLCGSKFHICCGTAVSSNV
jgi:hypothetical protein